MAKITKEVTAQKNPLANPQGKTVEELKDIVQNLQIQMNQEQTLLTQAQTTIQTHQTKLLKMQGLMEGLIQMIPKEEVEKMIAEERENHHQNGQKTS